MKEWSELKFWDTGEWQVAEENLRLLTKKKIAWCPGWKNLFKAMELCPFEETKVAIIGQDPYPDPKYACGLAFSIPKDEKTKPPTLVNILEELQSDIHVDRGHGDLSGWARQGVFLWNAVPSCEAFNTGSHYWPEWELLTQEILQELSKRGILFVFLGRKAEEQRKHVDEGISRVLYFTHPSPRAQLNTKSTAKFSGCRLFSEINRNLLELGLETINWRE